MFLTFTFGSKLESCFFFFWVFLSEDTADFYTLGSKQSLLIIRQSYCNELIEQIISG